MLLLINRSPMISHSLTGRGMGSTYVMDGCSSVYQVVLGTILGKVLSLSTLEHPGVQRYGRGKVGTTLEQGTERMGMRRCSLCRFLLNFWKDCFSRSYQQSMSWTFKFWEEALCRSRWLGMLLLNLINLALIKSEVYLFWMLQLRDTFLLEGLPSCDRGQSL